MRKTLLAIAAIVAPTIAFATDYAVITAVHPIYADNYVTKYETHCYDVEVPIYGQVGSGSTGDVLAGAIIGGAIGNQFGGGSGKDAMTVLGAILGAHEGSRSGRSEVVGYRIENQCNRVATYVNEPVISHYNIRYEYKGVEYHERTTRRYTLGQRVTVQTSLR
jgi:uncharacterized protein YcfJ